MRPEQQRVKHLLTEAISLLCRNSLQFKEDVTVEGLLGITLDKSDIFLVSINETVQQTLRESAAEVRAEKRNVDHNSDDGHTPKKRRRRRGSREGSSSPPPSPADQIESQPDNPTAEPLDRVNIKSERTYDEPSQPPEDGRHLNPAHDSTSEPLPDSKALIQKQTDFPASTSLPGGGGDAGGAEEVQVKQEVLEEEEDCFLIDSDSEDASDTSHSLPPDGNSMGSHNWADQQGFNLTELDMMAAANFQQFGNMDMASGANNLANMSWDPSQGQGQPSTSGTQDSSQRKRPFACPKCGRSFTQSRNLYQHDREVHLKLSKYSCHICGKSCARRSNLKKHMALTFPRECCGKTYTTAGWWLRHRISSHSHTSSKYRYKCHLCECVIYPFAYQLRTHYRLQHPDNKVKEKGIVLLPLEDSQLASFPADPAAQTQQLPGAKVPLPVLPKPDCIYNYQCRLCKANFRWLNHLWQHLKDVHNITNTQDMAPAPIDQPGPCENFTGTNVALPSMGPDAALKDPLPFVIQKNPVKKPLDVDRPLGDPGPSLVPGSRLLIPMPDGKMVPLEIISPPNPVRNVVDKVSTEMDAYNTHKGNIPKVERHKIRMIPQRSQTRANFNALRQSEGPAFVIAPISSNDEDEPSDVNTSSKKVKSSVGKRLKRKKGKSGKSSPKTRSNCDSVLLDDVSGKLSSEETSPDNFMLDVPDLDMTCESPSEVKSENLML